MPVVLGYLPADPGLQPERTTLAWGRTTLAMGVVSLLFLRWVPDYGGFSIVLIGLSLLSAGGMNLHQRRRYRHSDLGIRQEQIQADVVVVMIIGGAVGLLAILGLYAILFLPVK
jgi:uncharacterized membrane protein YidH (DUF202 family)